MEQREVTLDVSVDELLAEQFDYLGVEPEPSIEEGWLQYKRDILPNKPDKMTEHMLRAKYEKGIRDGTNEKKVWGRLVYYRTITQKEIHEEDPEKQED